MKLKRKVYQTRSERIKDFFLGFILQLGIVAISLAPFSIFVLPLIHVDTDAVALITSLLIVVGVMGTIVVGLLIYLYRTSYWAALGLQVGFLILVGILILYFT